MRSHQCNAKLRLICAGKRRGCISLGLAPGWQPVLVWRLAHVSCCGLGGRVDSCQLVRNYVGISHAASLLSWCSNQSCSHSWGIWSWKGAASTWQAGRSRYWIIKFLVGFPFMIMLNPGISCPGNSSGYCSSHPCFTPVIKGTSVCKSPAETGGFIYLFHRK